MNFKKLLSTLLLGTVLSFSTITAEEVGQEYELTGITDYDENGNKIYVKNNEIEGWYEYDENNRMTHSQIHSFWEGDYEEIERWYSYDSEGKLFGVRFNGGEEWYDYNSKKHTLVIHTTTGDSEWKYDCDENWNRLHGTNGYIEWWNEYDSNGNLILERYIDGLTINYEYDSQNRLVKKIDHLQYITTYEYDSNGNLAVEDPNFDSTKYYFYTYWPNGKLKARRQFILKQSVIRSFILEKF